MRFAGLKDTVASVSEILKDPELSLIIPDSYYNIGYYGVTYELLQITANSDTLLYFEVKQRRLPEKIIQWLEFMEPGDKLVLQNIRAVGVFCPRKYRDIILTIRE